MSWWLAEHKSRIYGYPMTSLWISRKGLEWYAVAERPVVGVIPKTLSKHPWSDWLLAESYPNVRIWQPYQRRV